MNNQKTGLIIILGTLIINGILLALKVDLNTAIWGMINTGTILLGLQQLTRNKEK